MKKLIASLLLAGSLFAQQYGSGVPSAFIVPTMGPYGPAEQLVIVGAQNNAVGYVYSIEATDQSGQVFHASGFVLRQPQTGNNDLPTANVILNGIGSGWFASVKIGVWELTKAGEWSVVK